MLANHAEVMQFPDNYVLSEPYCAQEIKIPLIEVQQSILVEWINNERVFIAVGIDENDELSVAFAQLSLLSNSIKAGTGNTAPVTLPWTIHALDEMSFDLTARKLLTISRESANDTLVVLAASASYVYFFDLRTGSPLYTLPYECDLILDIKYNYDNHQLGILDASTLHLFDVDFPDATVADANFSSPRAFTPEVLATMRDLLVSNRVPVSAASCNVSGIVSLVHHASEQGKRPCAIVWPTDRVPSASASCQQVFSSSAYANIAA